MTDADLRDITGLAVSARIARVALAVCSLGFLAGALLLMIDPTRAADWLMLPHMDPTEWALRLAGAALLGLAGQTWLVRRAGDHPVMGSSAVTVVTVVALGGLMLAMPGEWGWLRWVTLVLCGLTAAAFVVILSSSRRA